MKNVKIRRKNWRQRWWGEMRARFLLFIGAEEAYILRAAYNAMPKIVELSQNPNNVLVFSRSFLRDKNHIGKNVHVFGEDINISDCGFTEGGIVVDHCCRRVFIDNHRFLNAPGAAIQISGG
jgi:hypothetical protein